MPNLITKYTGNRAGEQEFLQSDPFVIELIDRMTAQVASAVQAEGPVANDEWGTKKLDVEVNSFVGQTWHPKGDRYAGMVTLAHPAGVALEAKHGYLKRAAEAAGFEWGRKNAGVTSELSPRETSNYLRAQARRAKKGG